MNGTHDLIKKNIWRAICTLAAIAGSLAMISTAQATLTDKYSSAYVQECLDNDVPLPPVFGKEFNFWKYTGQLTASQVFVENPQPTDIYYFISDSTNNGYNTTDMTQTGVELKLNKRNPEGVCMLAIRKAAGTHSCGAETGLSYSDSFQVICQGKKGNACFWNLKPGRTFPWGPGSPSSERARGGVPLPSEAIQPPFAFFSKGTAGPQCYTTGNTTGPLVAGYLANFRNPPFIQPADRSFDTYIVQLGGSNEDIDKLDTRSLPAWVGGAHLVGNKEGVCTACHAGENLFINHPGSPTDINPRSSKRIKKDPRTQATLPIVPDDFYFPKTWPNPIVPNTDSTIGGRPWPENPGPSAYDKTYSSACLGCHSQTGEGGRLPAIAGLTSIAPGRDYCSKVLSPSVLRTGSNNGAMPPDTTTRAYDTAGYSEFSHAMLDVHCNTAVAPLAGANGLTTAQDNRQIHKSMYQFGVHQHFLDGSANNNNIQIPASTPFNANDLICVNGFISGTANQTPTQVMVQFQTDNNNWEHRAYWGTDYIKYSWTWLPTDLISPANFKVSSNVAPGPVGYWYPYCVKASSVGMGGKYATGIAFTLYSGSMWWGEVYRQVNGVQKETLFTTPLDKNLSGGGGDFWQIVNTPAYLYWNQASWYPGVFPNAGYGAADSAGNIDLGPAQNNYCYMNGLTLGPGDLIAVGVLGSNWSVGGWNSTPSGQSSISANCIPYKDLMTPFVFSQMPTPSLNGTFFGQWNTTGANGSSAPSPLPNVLGGSPSTNMCVLDGLLGSFNPTGWGDLFMQGTDGFVDSPTGWYWSNKTPMGLSVCADVGIAKENPKPASAFSRGNTRWIEFNGQWSGGNGSVDLNAGTSGNANNQFCYLAGIEAKNTTGPASVNVVVADGTNTFTNSSGATIPAGHWVAHAQGGIFWAQIGCQPVPF